MYSILMKTKKGARRPYESFPGSSAPRSLFWGPIVKKAFTNKHHGQGGQTNLQWTGGGGPGGFNTSQYLHNQKTVS